MLQETPASRSMPGRRSSPRRNASRSCSAVAGRTMSDYVRAAAGHAVLSVAVDARRHDVRLRRRRRAHDRADPRRCDPTTSRATSGSSTYSRRVFEAGYVELAHTPFPRFSDMLRVAPRLAALRADRSVYSTVARFVRDEHVREALSFHSLLVGGNPFETSSIYTLIHYLERTWGVFFPRGGTGALVAALVRLFEELGGELRLSTPVARVRVDESAGRVRHLVTTARAHRRAVRSRRVECRPAPHVREALRAERGRRRPMVRRLEQMDWSMSLFVLYFGTDRSYADRVAHHTVVFGPRYRALLDDIFHGAALPDDFSLYLHAPHVTDPSLAPPGCGAFYVLSPVPHLGQRAARLGRPRPGVRRSDPRGAGAATSRPAQARRRAASLHTAQTSSTSWSPTRARHSRSRPSCMQSAYWRPHNKDARIPGPLPRRRRHPSGRRRARRDQRCEGDVLRDREGLPARAADGDGRMSESRNWSRARAALVARSTIAHHSRSFALASALLGRAPARRDCGRLHVVQARRRRGRRGSRPGGGRYAAARARRGLCRDRARAGARRLRRGRPRTPDPAPLPRRAARRDGDGCERHPLRDRSTSCCCIAGGSPGRRRADDEPRVRRRR